MWHRHVLPQDGQHLEPTNPIHDCSYWICDTLFERDAHIAAEADFAYVKETHRLYFWDGTEWRQVRY